MWALNAALCVAVHSAAEQLCCCTSGPCSDEHSVYSPNYDQCCRLLDPTWPTYGCPRFKSTFPWLSGYAERERRFCSGPQESVAPTARPPPAHTTSSEKDDQSGARFCETPSSCDPRAEVAGAESMKVRDSLLRTIRNELSRNSLKTAVEELMTVYVCARWVPDTDVLRVIESEMAAGHVGGWSALDAYANRGLIPLRCSENIGVYDAPPMEHREKGANNTGFSYFESRMAELAQWVGAESGSAMVQRQNLFDLSSDAIPESLLQSFNDSAIRSRLRTCEGAAESGSAPQSTVQSDLTSEASDCRTTEWWARKLRDWKTVFPFLAFMSGSAVAPGPGERILVCFGKRVASALHRRVNGSILMTDMNTVGCHGFWSMERAAQMLSGMAALWRPPTCQLAAMELRMKRSLMRLFVKMNEELFDALPALFLDQAFTEGSDVIPTAAAGAGVVAGFAKAISSRLASVLDEFRGTYRRLGQLLANTTVKWVVCSVNSSLSPEQQEELDRSLGDEDDYWRRNSKAAYGKFTGDSAPLPGELCDADSVPAALVGMRGSSTCSTYVLEADFVQPYWDREGKVDFVCPIDNVPDPDEQLDVISQHHKEGLCVLGRTKQQMEDAGWLYRGRTPHLKQNDKGVSEPTEKHEFVRIVKRYTYPDSSGVLRRWVKVGRRCSIAEAKQFPRWCTEPKTLTTRATDLRHGSSEMMRAAGAIFNRWSDLAGSLWGAQQAGKRKNRALVRQFSVMMKSVARNAFRWVRQTVSSSRRRRRRNLQELLFSEQPEADTVHSVSWQRTLKRQRATSNSKDRYERYIAVAPCDGFDPEREFELKYAAGELAYTLAVHGKQALMLKATATVSARAEAVLRIDHANSTWLEYRASVSVDQGPWTEATQSLLALVDQRAGRSDVGSLDIDRLHGVTARFVCGTKKELYSSEHPDSGSSLRECLKHGAELNARLRGASGGRRLHDPSEVAVRVTFSAESDGCTCVTRVRDHAATDPELLENELAKSFDSQCRGSCSPTPSVDSHLGALRGSAVYAGIVCGTGAPRDLLQEVLLDPEELLHVLVRGSVEEEDVE